ncbi:ribosomal-protein-alanine N-acetyltransferase [Sporomusaceae bacterium BoRhaA]|uniref:GNAT family N-acetyltransferase n=1 Tax=Pelorhabdus rhamnosifermentans TaxID=2772457 RepID=UPI001C061F0A|nr:GNAT family N-acetyltransferase [Pelorhabdus rhamnosifermentans]MBU2699705.1 ribosomal-protein-alanine N-acetyltransferase [Pelorhabdus rhamnosifermentans]
MIELVRTTETELIERLVQLESEAFGEGGMNVWHLVPLIRHGRVYAFRKDEAVIGVVQYMLDWDNPQKAYMIGVSISQESRGQGVGAELLRDSFNALSKENIKEVELTVERNNIVAVKLYESKFGFLSTDFRPNEYGEGEDRLVMKLMLANVVN